MASSDSVTFSLSPFIFLYFVCLFVFNFFFILFYIKIFCKIRKIQKQCVFVYIDTCVPLVAIKTNFLNFVTLVT